MATTYRIAVIGDWESVMGFRAIGLDTYPVTSYQEKIRMLEEAAREGQVLIYCHDAYTKCSTVKKVSNFFKKDKVIDL